MMEPAGEEASFDFNRSDGAPGERIAPRPVNFCIWDIAVAVSFFSRLKKERIRKRINRTRGLARGDVFEHTEIFNNRTRRHSHIGGVSPEALETAAA